MGLRRVQVVDFRCLQAVEVDLDSAFTLVTGPNASGKTSLLEAIYVLGRGRSFRTRRLNQLVRAHAERFVVYGVAQVNESRVGVGVEGSSEGTRARVGGERLSSLAELAALVPVQVIDPEVHRLIEEGPGRRRRFLDWGVFHVEHEFVAGWQRFQQILKQRNAALRLKQPRALVGAWDVELIRLGEAIHRSRSTYLDRLASEAARLVSVLLQGELTLHYRPGWARDLSFEEALAKSWTQDQEVGSTSVGPQRAEIIFRFNGEAVRERVSRGQQKLLAAALLLAQLNLFPREGSAQPTLLLDDPAAELDSDRLLGLISEIRGQSLQLLVTSLSDEFRAFGVPGRHYRIREGSLTQA